MIDGGILNEGIDFVKSEDLFKVFKLITRRVPFEVFQQLMLLDSAQSNRIWITNLGSLDKFNKLIASKGFTITYLYGGVSPTYGAVFVPIFTIDKKIHFQLHCLTPPHTEEKIEEYIKKSLIQLENALND